jgi:hypothetical protein
MAGAREPCRPTTRFADTFHVAEMQRIKEYNEAADEPAAAPWNDNDPNPP